MALSWKPYNENEHVKLGAYNFEIVKDYTYIGLNLTNKFNQDLRLNRELQMQIEHIMYFFLY